MFKMGGLSVLAGAVVSFLSLLYGSLFFSTDLNTGAGQPGWVLVYSVEFVGVALILLGLPVVAVALGDRAGRTGVAGIALIFVSGLMLGVFLPLLVGLGGLGYRLSMRPAGAKRADAPMAGAVSAPGS